jgi:hypothetical protein
LLMAGPSGIEPDISLMGQTPAPVNPITQIGGIVGLQSNLIQLQMQQNQLAANQKLGQIFSTSGSPEEAIQRIQQDPLGAYMGQSLDQYTGAMSAYRDILGKEQQQNASGFTSTMAALVNGLEDPSQIAPQFAQRLKLLPPDVQKVVGPAGEAAITALTDGLPRNADGSYSPQAMGMFKNRMAGLIVSSGAANPDLVRNVTGNISPQTVTGQFGPEGQLESRQVGGPLSGNAPAQGVAAPPLAAGPDIYTQQRLPEVAAYKQGLDDTTALIGNQLKFAGEIQGALEKARTGGGASVRQQLGQVGQAIGLPQDTVDKIAGGDLGAAQEASKLFVNTTMGQIQQQLPRGSHLAQAEFQTFTQNNPNLDTDPRAIEKIMGFWGKLYGQLHDEQQSFEQYRQQGGDLTEWQSHWQQQAIQKGYIKPDQFTGFEGGPNAQAAPKATPTAAGPAVGTVMQGRGGISYRFLGGNPRDRNSWEPVNGQQQQ